MPIDATPFEQVLVAVATNWTGEPTVAPLLGWLTVTVANAADARNTKMGRKRKNAFMKPSPIF
jgi:hypothetical protein